MLERFRRRETNPQIEKLGEVMVSAVNADNQLDYVTHLPNSVRYSGATFLPSLGGKGIVAPNFDADVFANSVHTMLSARRSPIEK